MAKERLLFIDILRIVGIVLVVTQHVITDSGLWPNLHQFYFNINVFDIYHIYYGNIGIWLFILASGCSLALNHSDIDTLVKVRNFYAGRLLRIYPVYWVAILFNLAMLSYVIPTLSTVDYVKMFSGFQAFFEYTFSDFYGKVNGAFWFIGVLVFLYLLYPVLSVLIKKHPHLSLCSLFILSLISRIVMNQLPWVRGYDWFPLCRVFEFGLGIYFVQTKFYFKTVNTNSVVSFLGNTSFQIYLVQMPLLVLVKYNILLYLVTTLIISSMLYTFDRTLKQLITIQAEKIRLRITKSKHTS